MPHSPEEKKRVITRLRRIKGQTEALERAVEVGTECGALLQQLAALRGAATGLMAEVLDSHLRETFGSASTEKANSSLELTDIDAEIDQIMRIIRSYLK
jgi:DNA-binding FrmR family transcriptional regulator